MDDNVALLEGIGDDLDLFGGDAPANAAAVRSLAETLDDQAEAMEILQGKVLARLKRRPKALITFDRTEETFSLQKAGINLVRGLIKAEIGKMVLDPDATGYYGPPENPTKYYRATVHVRVSSPYLGSTVEMGFATSKGGFYTGRKDYDDIHGPQLEALIQKHARTQAIGNGIMALVGLTGLSREELRDAGIDPDGIDAGFKRGDGDAKKRPAPPRKPTPPTTNTESPADVVKDVFPGATDEEFGPDPVAEMKAMLAEVGVSEEGAREVIRDLGAFQGKDGVVDPYPERMTEKHAMKTIDTVAAFVRDAKKHQARGDEKLTAAAATAREKKGVPAREPE